MPLFKDETPRTTARLTDATVRLALDPAGDANGNTKKRTTE